MDPNIQKVLDDQALFQKDILSTNTMGQAGNTGLSRQFLDGVIKTVSDRNTPLRDRISREKGEGLAAAWNIRTTVNNIRPIDLVYAENGLPATMQPTFVQKTASYKPLGYVQSISNFAIEAGRSYLDLEAEITEAGIRSVTQAEESLLFHSDSTITNVNSVTSFDGFDRQLQTNIVPSVGAFTTDALDHAFQMIRANGGGTNPSRYVIVCSFGIQRKINQIQQAGSGMNRVMYNAADLQNTRLGLNTTWYESPIGVVEVLGDYFVNPQGTSPYPFAGNGSSSATGATTSNMYILDLNSMKMIDLLPLCKDTLGMIADNRRVLVKEYTTLAVEVEQYNAMLTGITEPSF